MDLDTAKRLMAEFEADREQIEEAERRRDAANRRDALALIARMTADDVQATFTDICEKQPIVRLGQGEYEKRIYE